MPGGDAPELDAAPTETRLSELRSSMQAAVAVSRTHAEALETLRAETKALHARSNELRRQRRDRVDELRTAARVRRGR
jgi:hypothetical protein